MSDEELDEEMREMLELQEAAAGFNRDLGLDDIDIPVIILLKRHSYQPTLTLDLTIFI